MAIEQAKLDLKNYVQAYSVVPLVPMCMCTLNLNQENMERVVQEVNLEITPNYFTLFTMGTCTMATLTLSPLSIESKKSKKKLFLK